VQITIYHNPNCGTSRDVLSAIRAAGHEPHIVEYLKTPFSRTELESLIERMGVTPRDIVRTKEKLYAELGLGEPSIGQDQILDAMIEYPSLVNRPIVTTEGAAKLCRPSSTVQELLAGGTG
jgi:arsenate reductase